MKRTAILAFLVTALTVGGWNSDATASDYGMHGGLPWFAYGYSGSLYGLGRVPVPPYYALHPPVYYSQPVARPYGHSPFAWKSPTSEVLTAPPQVTINPYYKPTEKKTAVDGKQTARRVIVNRFFLTSQK